MIISARLTFSGLSTGLSLRCGATVFQFTPGPREARKFLVTEAKLGAHGKHPDRRTGQLWAVLPHPEGGDRSYVTSGQARAAQPPTGANGGAGGREPSGERSSRPPERSEGGQRKPPSGKPPAPPESPTRPGPEPPTTEPRTAGDGGTQASAAQRRARRPRGTAARRGPPRKPHRPGPGPPRAPRKGLRNQRRHHEAKRATRRAAHEATTRSAQARARATARGSGCGCSAAGTRAFCRLGSRPDRLRLLGVALANSEPPAKYEQRQRILVRLQPPRVRASFT